MPELFQIQQELLCSTLSIDPILIKHLFSQGHNSTHQS